MTADTLSKRAADPERIGQFIQEIAEIGRDPRGGWTRLGFSVEERRAHDVMASWAADLGMKITRDAIGNTYGDFEGLKGDPLLVIGSHLDTVPQGGSFDGVAGVAAAVEAARILSSDGRLDHTLRVVAFAAEEGARFGVPCIGSRAVTGTLTMESLADIFDASGTSILAAAAEVDLHANAWEGARWPRHLIGSFLELHIEQGAVLETRARQIGVVDVIAGSTRLQLTFRGRTDHSGSTPMDLRRDALAAAAELILEVEKNASKHPTTVATVGRISVQPDSLTTVPGQSRISLDVRDIDSDAQRDLAENLLDQAVRISRRREVDVTAELISDQSPVLLHRPIREKLCRAASDLGVPFRVMPSGAGHDAGYLAAIVPAGMLFVPSRGGVSHSPDEWSDVRDIARGVDVVVAALKMLDAQGPWRI